MSNKAHLRPHRKKRQASRTTGLLLVIGFIALVALATAMVASGHAMPAGRIIPLRGGRCARPSRGDRSTTGIERSRSNYAFELEPPIGIEPMTYALRVRRSDRLS
jgi:hypothetical protein